MGLFLSRLYDVFSTFTADKPARILMLGLDAAGKTTILYKVKLNENLQTIPTIGMYLFKTNKTHWTNQSFLGFNVEQVSPCRGVSFTVWDVCISMNFIIKKTLFRMI